ncbi:flagellar hook-basal body complex protein FliE [Calditrichota bacterium LG25]
MMAGIDKLQSVNVRELQGRSTASVEKQTAKQTGEVKSFGETISEFVQAVNDAQKDAAQEVSDVIQGRSQNLHQAMTTIEEARLSFQLMLEVRNKLLEGYQELSRMQV